MATTLENETTCAHVVVVLTSGNILRGVAVECEVVEDGSLWAAGHAWVLALHADVEATAVIGLDVTGVVEDVSVGVHLGHVRAGEAIVEDLNTDSTSSSDAGVLPLAGSCELVEDQTSGAGPQYWETVGALVVLVTVGGVLVLKVTVHAGALDA